MNHRIATGTLFAVLAVLMVEDVYADVADDLELARKFSPILILTEETGGEWGDIRVIKPEPVEIVGADSLSNLHFTAKDLGNPRTSIISDTLGINWHPQIDKDRIEANCNVDFSQNYFAFLRSNCNIYGIQNGRAVIYEGIWSRCQTRDCGLPRIPVRGLIFPGYFDYPGDTPTSWNDIYFGEGDNDGNTHMGRNFGNTAYVHIYKTTHEVYSDSITVIQYFYFYPYNHWWNNHEGDWERIHVVVDSRDAATAEVIGVEYLFHSAHLSYYKNYPYNYNDMGQTVENTGRYYPGLTSSYVFTPRHNLKLSQSTHPIVYVGAGSHGAYPTGGTYITYELSILLGLLSYDVPERMTHTGVVLSTQADDSHTNLWESYDLLVLPDSLNRTGINRGLPDSLSWLGADVLWGTPQVDGRGKNDSPQGPYHKGWERLGFFNKSTTGLNAPVIEDRIFHSVVPHRNYHHWPIIGSETWGDPTDNAVTLSLAGDVVVFPGATLTITPGTVIEFDPGSDRHQFTRRGTAGDPDRSEIFVYGTLISEGTSDSTITFRKKSGTTWQGEHAWGGVKVQLGGTATVEHTHFLDLPPPRPCARRG